MSEAQVAQFLAIFPTVRVSRVRELIDACTGNVDQAVELYLVQGDSVADSVAPPARARHAASAAAAATADEDDDVILSDRPAATSSAASSSSRKRKEAAAPSSKAAAPSPIASPSKRAKGKGAASKEANQHSLASFFQKSPTAAAAAVATVAAATSSKNGSSAVTLSQQMDESARSQRRQASPTSTAAAAAASSSTNHAAAASSSAAAAAAPTFLSLTDNLAPAAASSDPLRACWLPGAPVPFLFLSRLFHLIEGENGRIKITNWLCYGFWQILAFTPADLPAALFLASDQLAPSYLNHQMGVGGSMLVKLVCEMTGVPHAKLSADHQRLGDLGLIAAQYRLTQTLLFRPAPLGVAQVFNSFYSLADINKRDRKEMLLKKLFAAARESELTYLIRIAEGGLRIGAVVTTVLSALAKAFVLHHLYCEGVPEDRRHEVCTFERVLKATETVKGAAKAGIIPFALNPAPADASPAALAASIARRLPSHLAHATAKLRRAYSELPNFHAIMPVLLKSPTAIYELHKHIKLTAGVPIKPQLGKPLTSIVQMLKLFKGLPFTIEIKYDGLRAQVHRLASGQYRIFSRHLMDQGDRWNDLIPFIEAARKGPEQASSFIIDAEIVAIEHDGSAAAVNGNGAGASSAAASSAAAASSSAAATTGSDGAAASSYRILPFQELSTRKRKGDSSAAQAAGEAKQVSCMIFAFDFLSLNGESLLLRSLPERRALMAATFTEHSGEFQFVEHCDISAASASNITIEELDEEEENEKKKPKAAKAKAKSKKETGAAAAAKDLDEQANSSDEEEVEEIGAPASKSSNAVGEDEEELQLVQLASSDETAEESKEKSSPASSAAAAAAASSASSDSATSSAAPSAMDQISHFLRAFALPRGEGLMAKSLSPSASTYEPDVRTDLWAKLKKDYIDGCGVADSIDVVVLGAWFGNGRKAGWFSPFLVGIYNPDTEEFESFAKVMSGFTDAVYKQFTEECKQIIIPTQPKDYRVNDALIPTVWFKPIKVWEIRGADLTISPVHTAANGMIHESRGISLRFPRFIRVRDDKSIDQCTTSEQVAAMYRGQATVHPRHHVNK